MQWSSSRDPITSDPTSSGRSKQVQWDLFLISLPIVTYSHWRSLQLLAFLLNPLFLKFAIEFSSRALVISPPNHVFMSTLISEHRLTFFQFVFFTHLCPIQLFFSVSNVYFLFSFYLPFFQLPLKDLLYFFGFHWPSHSLMLYHVHMQLSYL